MKFYVKDCPGNMTLFQWISEESKLEEAKKDVQCSTDPSRLITIPHQLDIQSLIKITTDCLDQFGFRGWQTQRGDANAYGGLSLVYNPNITEDKDPNQSTLGTKKNMPNEFFYGTTERFDNIRNTYFDSYGFRKLSPCVIGSGLHEFIKGFRLSPTRSRLGVLDAAYHDKVGEDFLWHKDETVFENLRINIPIETDSSFMFQIENQSPEHLGIGNIYTWDTNIAHRVYPTDTRPFKRIHLVLGFSPWLDYCEDDDSFTVNEFFGKIHPIDLLLKGHAHGSIGL
jgi:hypothetical protein